MSPRLSRLFEISLVAIVMAIYLYAALSDAHNFATEWFIRDDAFYYFKVAQNITEGRGITFDGINPTNGYHPLWMIVCIPVFALARFDLILPLRMLVVVSGAISAWTGVLLFRLVGRALSPPAAVLAATYWSFDRFIHYNVTMFGLETGITALMMTAFLLAIANLEPDFRHKPLSRQLWTLGLLAVAMTFSRLDTVFLALLAGVWILLRGTPIRYYLMFDIAVIVTSAFVSVALRTGLPSYFVYTKSAILLAAFGLLIQIPSFYIFGLYHPFALPNESTRSSLLRRKNFILHFTTVTLVSAGVVALGLIGLSLANQLEGLPRSALPLYAGLVLVGAGGVRLAGRRVASNHLAPARFTEVRQNWKQWLREGIHFYGILGGALAIYMLFNKTMFGTSTPVSGQIKLWWGSLQGSAYGNPISSLSGFLGLEKEEGLNAWGPIVYALRDFAELLGGNLWIALGTMVGLALLILAAKPKRAAWAGILLGLPVLLGGSILQMFYYNGLGYSGAKDWYWVSQMLMFALLGALLFDLLLRPLRRFQLPSRFRGGAGDGVRAEGASPSPAIGRGVRGEGQLPSPSGRGAGGEGKLLAWILTAVLCIGIYVYPFANIIIHRMPWGTERAGQPYMDVIPFLEANTEEGALIGMTGGGNIGYFIEGRTIVNMDGLINSYAYFRALQAGKADEYLAAMGLDYIFSNPDILQAPPYNGQFDEWSESVAEFGRKELLRLR